MPIHGKPLLGYWLDMLLAAGSDPVLVNTHYLPDKVREFCARSPWRDRINVVHEDVLLGTGGTILANRAFFGRRSFMVVHADNLSRFSVAQFIGAHQKRPPAAAMTMMTFTTDSPQSCGIVETDAAGLVRRFHEKVKNPPGDRANGAVYIMEPEVIDFLESLGNPVIDLSTEVIPRFLGRIATFYNDDYHRDIGSQQSLQAAEREFR